MRLTCPHCQFSKEIPAAQLPIAATRVSCPQCKGSFFLPQHEGAEETRPQICCPACGLSQAETAVCTSCGLIYARYRPGQGISATTEPGSPNDDLRARPKAGFWLRLVALMVDGFLVFMMQIIFSMLLVFVGSRGFHLHGSVAALAQIFSIVLSLFYWIFFTGYCGQTPGKMLLRIKVIGIDGTPLGYGKAFYREMPGKFISGILLGIGYLMAAFDDQKQALHDRMARTYVIKL